MKKLAVLFLLFFKIGTPSILAQTNFCEATWSAWLSKDSLFTPYKYFGQDDEAHYGLMTNDKFIPSIGQPNFRKELYFFKWKKSGEIMISKLEEFSKKKNTLELIEPLTLNDKFYLVVSKTSEPAQTVEVLAFEISKTGQLQENPAKLITLPLEDVRDFRLRIEHESEDPFFYLMNAKYTNTSKIIKIVKYDFNFRNLFNRDYVLLEEPEYELVDFKIKQNLLAVVGRRYALLSKVGLYPKELVVSFLDLDVKERKDYTVPLKDAYLKHKLAMEVNEEGDIVVAGLFCYDANESLIKPLSDGMYCIRLSKEGLVSSNLLMPYPDAMRVNYQKFSLKGHAVMYTPHIDCIKFRQDGSIVLVGEGDRIQTYDYTKVNMCDVLVASISKTGDLEWLKTVPKNQETMNYSYLRYYSYFFGFSEEKLYFMYNDGYKNIANPDPTSRAAFLTCGDAGTALAIIDRKGVLTRREVFTEDNEKHQTCNEPLSALKISDREFFVIRSNKQKAKAGVVVFK